MSFGGGGGGGFSFGSTNNNQSGGFSGFGSNTNTGTGTGFGSNTSNTGFGASTATSNPFGGNSFGSNTGGGFGASNTTTPSLFGNKPASNPFGASTTNAGGGLFGASTNTNTGGFGAATSSGFGSTNNAFGANPTSNPTFSFGGASKPAFGASTNSTPLFGQGGAGTTGSFGSSSSPFGAAGSGTALGNQPVPPSDGTASTPYAPTLEKESAGNSSNYQSINFMPPYQKYSFEELRLADYNAGRRYGNATAGFGGSTFGGFGSTNTGFGGNSNTSNPFGSTTTPATGGFGSNNQATGLGGGGLFANKPATGGLFGQASSPAPSGGLFGTTNNTSNTGATANTGFGGGTGLFGNNQNKPNPFGGAATNTTPSFSFGGNTSNTSSGGLFGTSNNTPNANPFGASQPQSGGLFGNSGQQQQKPSLFGNTGGGFGAPATQSQASGGLFGNANSTTGGGGLFGNTNNTPNNTGGGLFGNTPTNSGTSLFGNNNANNAPKPSGLFGGGGSTFGNTNAGNTGGLFGNAGTNNQQTGGLFGNTNTNTGAGFSFGNSTNKPAINGLFSNTNTNNQQSGFGFNSFGAGSQNNQQGTQAQQDFKQSSLNDPNPYGQTSIWTGLPMPTPENSKPLFTPLTATQKLKESQSKPPPGLRLNQSRYMTPPRRPGFGFSYSTYATPNSAASTPGTSGLSNSMYGSRSFNGGSFGRSFGKSASASNLRSHFNGDSDSVLSPTAFVATNTRWSGGNMRRLTIDRSLRTDLFSRPSLPAFPSGAADKGVNGSTEPPALAHGESPAAIEPVNKLKKRVSFDKDTSGGQNGSLNGETGALVRTESDGDEGNSDSRGRAGAGSATPEAEAVRGNELAVVPEDRESDNVVSRKASVQAKPDPQPGDYWMNPSRAELSKMPRDRLSRFVGFQVGRKGCGKVEFNGAVDLTSLPLDDLYEKIVEIRLRSVTVYPDASTKPPVGKGLNVPSTISIENSWPRSRGQPSSATSGPIFEKHVNRLKKMHGTEFVNYEVTTGVWTFRVPHYTRYGLDYDDEDALGQSQLSSAPPDSLLGSRSGDQSAMEIDNEEQDENEEIEDDTFAFKQKTLPGGFGRQSVIDFDTKASSAESDSDAYDDSSSDNEVSMVGSYPPQPVLDSPNKPILKAGRLGTPGKALINIDGDWAEQLQRTISPRKQNREALRDVQNKVLLDRAYEPIEPMPKFNKPNVNKNEFRTSIDIMNSLFSRHEEKMARLKGRKADAPTGPEFEFPYAKRAKTFDAAHRDDQSFELSEQDRTWHASFKPHFTPISRLVYKAAAAHEAAEGDWATDVLVQGEESHRDIVVTTVGAVKSDKLTMDIHALLADAAVHLTSGVPSISRRAIRFSQLKNDLVQQHASSEEAGIYELLHALFDDYDDEFTQGLSRQQQTEYQGRIRKDRLSKYLSALIWQRHGDRIQASKSLGAASAAVMFLTAGNIKAACDALLREKDFHLTLLVAQIEQADTHFQDDIADQLAAWRSQGTISEMSEEIRSLYEILSGNTSIVQGKQNVPVEDRASTFAISEKFELDWVQAFALCLWYGRQKNGEIHDVVADFGQKLTAGLESASPITGEHGHEDPLWVALKIFASNAKTKGGSRGAAGTAQVEKPILPQALSALSQAWDCHKTFRLHHSLAAAVPGITVDHDKADDLSASLAFEYSTQGNVAGAAYALLHLKDSAKRASALRDLLTRHAAALPSPADDTQAQPPLWTALTTSLKLPTSWIYQAKALYARSSNLSLAELNYLILAADFATAHECLLHRVAPRLVIDEDWESLRDALDGFGANPEEKVTAGISDLGGHGTEWEAGGRVYADFVALVGLVEPSVLAGSGRRGSASSDADGSKGKTKAQLLARLQTALTSLNTKSRAGGRGAAVSEMKAREKLEERVALCEMGKIVARVLELDAEEARSLGDMKSTLDLPLTSDVRLSQARALGVEYYRGIMATAR